MAKVERNLIIAGTSTRVFLVNLEQNADLLKGAVIVTHHHMELILVQRLRKRMGRQMEMLMHQVLVNFVQQVIFSIFNFAYLLFLLQKLWKSLNMRIWI